MRDAVTNHAKTDVHKAALQAVAAPQKNNDMSAHILTSNQKNVNAVMKRMRSLYWLCKECLAISKFNSLIEMEEENGAYDDVVGCFDNTNATYTSHDFANDCVEVLATAVREEMLDLISRSPYVGVMIDEGTDINITSQLVLYR